MGAYRTTLVIIFTAFAGQASFAQIFDKTKGKNVEKLYNQTTHVYSYGKSAYHDRLTKAFNAYWKVTPFQFHDISKTLPSLPSGSSVFMPVVIGIMVRDHATSMNNPFYIFAEAGSSGRPNAEGIITAFPINGFHYEFDVLSDSEYHRSLLRLPYIVYNMNDMLSHLKAKGDEKGYFKGIEAKASRIATKTMLIPSDLLAEWNVHPNTQAMMKANFDAGKKPMKPIMAAILDQSDITYSGKFKVMSTADIIKLEESPEASQYALFLPAIDNKRYMMVFDLQTKELLYYETSAMGMKIKDKDFSKLNKAVGF